MHHRLDKAIIFHQRLWQPWYHVAAMSTRPKHRLRHHPPWASSRGTYDWWSANQHPLNPSARQRDFL